MTYLTRILAFIPLGLEVLLVLLVPYKVGGIEWLVHIPITLLLAAIGIGLVSNKKYIQHIGTGALLVLTILLGIIGYYDYIQWFSTIVGILLFVYFLVIRLIIKVVKHRD